MLNFIGKYFRWHLSLAGKLYQEVTVRANGKLFCSLFNARASLRGKEVRFEYNEAEKIYTAHSKKYKRYFYAKFQNYNTYSDGISERGLSLGAAYFLPRIPFEPNDVVIDCGANIGDLKLYFDEAGISVTYVGIEPSPKEYACLAKNSAPSETFNMGLWNEDGSLDFYVSSHNADSSFFQPVNYTDTVKIPTKRLDSVFDKPIKLLKIEAEGAEPEALAGCERLLDRVDYITADLGFERGRAQESTLVPVTNFLLSRNFEMVDFSSPRIVALYRNKNAKSNAKPSSSQL